MANVFITNVCNANCAFCFAQEQTQLNAQFLSLSEFEERLRWVQDSGMKQVRLMGGEPTLHPLFIPMAERVMAAGLTLVVFSNGYMPEPVWRYLADQPTDHCAVLMNVNAQTLSSLLETRREAVLRNLGKQVTLGYTILDPVFDVRAYLDWVDLFQLQRRIRLGLAQPIYGGRNQFLPPGQYRLAALSILEQARYADARGVRLEFDCGFVRCMFTDAEREQLSALGVVAESHCAPNVDIGLDGMVFHCFSVSQMAVPLKDCENLKEAVRLLEQKRSLYRQSGVYPECVDCADRIQGLCCAGCLSLTLQRFHPAKVSF